MGTDIHLRAEVFHDGKWKRAEVDMPDDRNYWAFAVLANVRNGHGFAGSYTGDPVTPIAEPRGLPADAAWDEEERPGGLWLGDHDKSWVTLAELLAVDLDAQVTLAEETKKPLRDCAPLLVALIERLSWLCEEGVGPERVRIIFGFDS